MEQNELEQQVCAVRSRVYELVRRPIEHRVSGGVEQVNYQFWNQGNQVWRQAMNQVWRQAREDTNGSKNGG